MVGECLQVAQLIDSTASEAQGGDKLPGVRQLLEKKEGLFRMNIMGAYLDASCAVNVFALPLVEEKEGPLHDHNGLAACSPFEKARMRRCCQTKEHLFHMSMLPVLLGYHGCCDRTIFSYTMLLLLFMIRQCCAAAM